MRFAIASSNAFGVPSNRDGSAKIRHPASSGAGSATMPWNITAPASPSAQARACNGSASGPSPARCNVQPGRRRRNRANASISTSGAFCGTSRARKRTASERAAPAAAGGATGFGARHSFAAGQYARIASSAPRLLADTASASG